MTKIIKYTITTLRMKKYNFHKSDTTDKYIKVLGDISKLRRKRQKIIDKHFYELYHYNLDTLEDRDFKITRIIGKTFEYPNSFLASSLGFNRTTWNKKYEEILNKLDLMKKPKYQTLRNMLEFEKLKYLIIKYYEKKDLEGDIQY